MPCVVNAMCVQRDVWSTHLNARVNLPGSGDLHSYPSCSCKSLFTNVSNNNTASNHARSTEPSPPARVGPARAPVTSGGACT